MRSSRNSRRSRTRPSIRSGRKSRWRRRSPDWKRLSGGRSNGSTSTASQPVARDRFDEFLKQSSGGRGKRAVRRRQGSAVQAVPGVGGRAERAGAGPAAAGRKSARANRAIMRRSRHCGASILGFADATRLRQRFASSDRPRFSAARAASRCSGVMWLATMPDRGGEHRGIVGEAEHRQHVRNEIERQDEIGDRAEQRRLHMARRLPVERAVIGREQILGERQLAPPPASA